MCWSVAGFYEEYTMFYFCGPQIPRFPRTADKRKTGERKAKCSRVRLKEESRNMDFQPVMLTVFH